MTHEFEASLLERKGFRDVVGHSVEKFVQAVAIGLATIYEADVPRTTLTTSKKYPVGRLRVPRQREDDELDRSHYSIDATSIQMQRFKEVNPCETLSHLVWCVARSSKALSPKTSDSSTKVRTCNALDEELQDFFTSLRAAGLRDVVDLRSAAEAFAIGLAIIVDPDPCQKQWSTYRGARHSRRQKTFRMSETLWEKLSAVNPYKTFSRLLQEVAMAHHDGAKYPRVVVTSQK